MKNNFLSQYPKKTDLQNKKEPDSGLEHFIKLKLISFQIKF
jgi:hypothetical protein